jgi:hypothetical protein
MYGIVRNEASRDVLADILHIFGDIEAENIGSLLAVPKANGGLLSHEFAGLQVIRQQVGHVLFFVVSVDSDALEHSRGFVEFVFVVDHDVDLRWVQGTFSVCQFLST